jgi:hypothetical protein
MKNVLVVTVFALALALTAQAQFNLGVKAGVNATGFFTESTIVTKQTPNVNFNLGGFAQYDFWKLTLQPELKFSQRGFTMNDAYDKYYLRQIVGLTTTNKSLDFTSYHIEMPINLLYKHSIGKSKLFVELGPQLVFNLGGKLGGSSQAYKSYSDLMSFHWVDYSVGGGLGVEYNKFLLGSRWDWYLGKIGTKKVDATYEVGNLNVFNEMKYLNLNLYVGYLF